MTIHHRAVALAAIFVAVLVTAACGSKTPKPSTTRLTFSATADSNPDATGRPSPVVVRLYQLKADMTFSGADFFALYDDEKKALGADFIGRDEFVLAPGENRTVEVAISADTRFVGMIAAYRDIRNAQWRVVVAAPLRNNGTVAIERARIQYTVR
jgi:type VI secretion system protein VasD